jgi:CDP-4-dehydro-6-deoxyglucose reductase, E1
MIKLIKSTYYNEKQTTSDLIEFLSSAKQLSFGKQCEKFENELGIYQGREHAIFVNSGSSANLAIIQSLLNLGRLKKGDKVAFSSLTWSTNAMPIIQLGLEAIPVDVELDTLNVSSRTFSQALELHGDIKMLFITNLLGFSDDLDQISSLCSEKNIILIEDNCESMGSVYKGKKLGNFGLASTFSFYVGHHMSTIEGGAILTDDEELSTMLRLVRAHGWDRNLSLTKQEEMRNKHDVNSTFYSRYTFYDLGYNLRPTEINGFLGHNQLKHIDEITKKRNENFLAIAPEIYSQTDRFYSIKYEHMDFLSNFAIPVICKTQEIRDELVRKCADKIEIRPVVGGNMADQPFFKKYLTPNLKNIVSPNASLIHQNGLYFGNNPELTQQEIAEIISIFTQ